MSSAITKELEENKFKGIKLFGHGHTWGRTDSWFLDAQILVRLSDTVVLEYLS